MAYQAKPCSYCGKTWDQACAEADERGEECTGWGTSHGPGTFQDANCRDCAQAHHEAHVKAIKAHNIAQARGT